IRGLGRGSGRRWTGKSEYRPRPRLPDGPSQREPVEVSLLVFPFSAVVGSDDMALALSLSAVSPSIGGALVRGVKGSAPATMVRALAALLPEVEVIAGCRFACDPADPDPQCPDGPHAAGAETVVRPARLVELPVGASEDRVTGALHLGRVLAEGAAEYEP